MAIFAHADEALKVQGIGQHGAQLFPDDPLAVIQQGQDTGAALLQGRQQVRIHAIEGRVVSAVVRFRKGEPGGLQKQPGGLGTGDGQGGLSETAELLGEPGIGGAVAAEMGFAPVPLDGAQAVGGQKGAQPLFIQAEAGVAVLIGDEILGDALPQGGGGGGVVRQGVLVGDHRPVPAAGVRAGAPQAVEACVIVRAALHHGGASFVIRRLCSPGW